MKFFTSTLLFIFLFTVSEKIFAQADYQVLGPLVSNGCNDRVYTILAAQPASNVVYIGGNFTYAGGRQTHYIVKYTDPSHTAQGTFSQMATADADSGWMNGAVRSLVYITNTLYAAGDFIQSDSLGTMVDTWHVAKWSGTYWTHLGEGLGNGLRGAGIYSLAVYNNNLYAGGYLDEIFNLGRGIEMWNGTSWVTLGSSGVPGVKGGSGYHADAMQVFNNELYVGGQFDTAGTVIAHNIAKWNGSTWSALGTGANGEIHAFTVIGTTLYVGGNFTSINGVVAKNIAKFDGTTWSALGNGLDSTVYGLSSYWGQLYATGQFSNSGATQMLHIARWYGSGWLPVYNNSTGVHGIDNTGYCLGFNSFNNTFYVGGFFATAGTVFANSIAKFYFNNIGINEIIEDDALNVYPNPSNGNVIVKWKNNYKRLLVEVFSIDGKNVYSLDEKNVINASLNLNLSTLPRGIYIAKFTTDDGMRVRKLIIE